MTDQDFNLDQPWLVQLDKWLKGLPEDQFSFTVRAVERARYRIPSGVACMLNRDAVFPYSNVTVRDVARRTRRSLMGVEGVGLKTMKVVMAFLKEHDITKLGPVNASR